MKIVIIGAGNIAHFFAKRLILSHHQIVQIYSRTRVHGEELAAHTGAQLIDNLSELTLDADVYILAIKDDAVQEIGAQIKLEDKIVIHCAGAVPLSAIQNTSKHTAVIWSLYSIRKDDLPQTAEVPLVVESSNDATLQIVLSLAKDISPLVLQTNFNQRQLLHLNAVLVNNFTNHLFSVAENICKNNQLPFDFLHPIIFQTVEQIKNSSPSKSQTGPAIRHDVATIKKHLSLLADQPLKQKMYQAITASIQE